MTADDTAPAVPPRPPVNPRPVHRWDPAPGDGERIWLHLLRQRDLTPEFVRLDTGGIVPVGRDADGEDDG